MRKEDKIAIIALVVLIGFFVSTASHFVSGFYKGLSYPFNSFLFPGTPFSDFYPLFDGTRYFKPYEYQIAGGVYFPLSYVLLYPFVHFLPQTSLTVFLIFSSMCIACFNWRYLCTKSKSKLDNCMVLCVMTLMTYPTLFAFERGNIEILLVIFMLLFLHFYLKKQFILSGFFLALVITSKLTPIVFLVLFVSDRQYKAAAYTLGYTGALTLLALCMFRSPILTSVHHLQQNLNWFYDLFVLQGAGSVFNSSLYGSLQTVFNMLEHHDITATNITIDKATMASFAAVYFYITACIGLIISLYVIFIEKTLWKKITILTCMMLLLPQISFDYKLLNLFIPLYVFINSDDKTTSFKTELFYSILLGLLFTPLHFIATHHHIPIVLSPFLHCGLMVALTVSIIWSGLRFKLHQLDTLGSQETNDFSLNAG